MVHQNKIKIVQKRYLFYFDTPFFVAFCKILSAIAHALFLQSLRGNTLHIVVKYW